MLNSSHLSTAMKKITPLLLLALLLSACSTPVEEAPLEELPSASDETVSAEQTRSYITEAGATYSVSFNTTDITETASGDTYHDFEIQGTGVYPGYMSVTSHKTTTGQTPEALVDLYFDPTHPKTAVEPTQIGENQVYLFSAPELSSATTEFAVIMLEGEAIMVMFQSAGPDQVSIDADHAVFMDFLERLSIN